MATTVAKEVLYLNAWWCSNPAAAVAVTIVSNGLNQFSGVNLDVVSLPISFGLYYFLMLLCPFFIHKLVCFLFTCLFCPIYQARGITFQSSCSLIWYSVWIQVQITTKWKYSILPTQTSLGLEKPEPYPASAMATTVAKEVIYLNAWWCSNPAAAVAVTIVSNGLNQISGVNLDVVSLPISFGLYYFLILLCPFFIHKLVCFLFTCLFCPICIPWHDSVVPLYQSYIMYFFLL